MTRLASINDVSIHALLEMFVVKMLTVMCKFIDRFVFAVKDSLETPNLPVMNLDVDLTLNAQLLLHVSTVIVLILVCQHNAAKMPYVDLITTTEPDVNAYRDTVAIQ